MYTQRYAEEGEAECVPILSLSLSLSLSIYLSIYISIYLSIYLAFIISLSFHSLSQFIFKSYIEEVLLLEV